MGVRIKLRRDLSTRFSAVNPVLSDGELAYEKDTGKFKIGDGITPWNDLPYISIVDSETIIEIIKTEDGHGSGLDADTLDGYHAYENQVSSSWYNRIPVVNSSGGIDIGSYIDFHINSQLNTDYEARILASNDRTISIKTKDNRDKYLITGTDSGLVIYVDNANGNDVTGNGSSTNPYMSIPRALSEVGEFINGNVTLVLKSSQSSYGNISLSGFIRRSSSSSFTIRGEMSIITSGNVTSHLNSVDDPIYGSIIQVARVSDSTKNWIQNQYKNKLLRVYKGSTSYYRIIIGNTSNSLYCSYTFPLTLDSSWAYEILDWAVSCDSIDIRGCFIPVTVNGVKIEGSVVVEDSSSGASIVNSYLKAISNQPNDMVSCNRSNLSIVSSYVDCNNTYVSAIAMNIPSNYVEVSGVIFDNCITSSIRFNYSYDKLTLSNGTRFYKGTTNPNRCIEASGGIIIASGLYGKNLMDSGSTGILLTRNAILQSSGNIVFANNVDTPISSYYGSIDGGKLISNDYLAVNETDYRNIHSRFLCKGSIATQVNYVNSSMTLGVNHHIIVANASNGNITLTLPQSYTCTGRQYIVKKSDSSSNSVIIACQSGETIDGDTSVSISSENGVIAVFSDGTSWRKMIYPVSPNVYVPGSTSSNFDRFEFDSDYTGVDASVAFGMLPCYSFSPTERGRIWGIFRNLFRGAISVSLSLGYALEGIQNNRNIVISIDIYGLTLNGVSFITGDTFTISTGSDQTKYYIYDPTSPVIPESAINSCYMFVISIDRRTDMSSDTYDGYFKLIDVVFKMQ